MPTRADHAGVRGAGTPRQRLSASAGCDASQLRCESGLCKPKFWQCDGIDDCGDNSDEEDCGGGKRARRLFLRLAETAVCLLPAGRCNRGEFSCGNHGCIPERLRCDGRDDCADGSDESQCQQCKWNARGVSLRRTKPSEGSADRIRRFTGPRAAPGP